MADVVLSAELQARVDQFVANLLTASNSADNTGRSVSDMSAGISRNIANVNRTNLSAFTNAMNNGTLSVQRLGAAVPAIVRPLTVGTNQAANALTNLGRVAQDAPFGFIGIQNNLNPLLESYQRLVTETGSVSAAFKALGSSLIGPAGLGIALSLVTSAITFYTMWQQKSAKATKEVKDDTEDYIKTLDQVTQAQLRGGQSAQKELTDLKLLFYEYQNGNLSLEQRKKAYQELQSKYPAYFENLKFEAKATMASRDAYERLSSAILESAKARAAGDLLTKNQSDKLVNEQKLIDLEAKRIKQQQIADKASKAGGFVGGSIASTATTGLAIEQNQALAKTIEEINVLKEKNTKLDLNSQRLLNSINEANEKGVSAVTNAGDALDSVKGLSDVLKELQIDLKVNEQSIEDTFNEKRIKDIDSYQKAVEELTKMGFTPASDAVIKLREEQDKLFKMIRGKDLAPMLNVQIPNANLPAAELKLDVKIIPQKLVISDADKLFKEAENKLNELTALPNIVSMVSGTLGDAFAGMGEAIAEGGSVLDAAGGIVKQAFASILSALGDNYIAMGVAKIAAGLLMAPFGAKEIGQGAGLVALGGALKVGGGLVGSSSSSSRSSVQQPTAFANGGIISGPTLGLMGEYAGAKSDPEVVAPLSKLKAMLGETDDMGNVLGKGGVDPILIIPETTIRGQDLVTVYNRASSSKRRQG